MQVIYLVRCGRKYHTDQSHRILLTYYFFYLREGQHFDLSPLAVQWVTTRLAKSKVKFVMCNFLLFLFFNFCFAVFSYFA